MEYRTLIENSFHLQFITIFGLELHKNKKKTKLSQKKQSFLKDIKNKMW